MKFLTVSSPITVALLLAAACSSKTAEPGLEQGTGGDAPATGGSVSTGGSAPTGGGTATGGATSQGGTTPASGGITTGGTSSTGGTNSGKGGMATGGAVGRGGATSGGASGGTAGAANGGVAAGGATTGACGPTTPNTHPFGCKFAWGIASPSGSLTNYSYLQFMSTWVGSEVKADGSISSCSACTWLTNQVSKTNIIPGFYAYFIGFYGHANGLPDGNQTSGQSLTTGGAALIKANRAKIVQMYAWYAQQVVKVWPTKPLIWLLEGDYVQYAGTSQSSPLSYPELGQLAADITCAIKSNMPNAVVAIDQSSWNADDITNKFWNAMAVANYDMVWTTGVGNNKGFLEAGTTATSYNHATATYAYLHTLTKRTILVDTSAGLSAAGDSWSSASVADLNARIADGVIAANITGSPPSNLQTNLSSRGALDALPGCQ